jgi:hypothetical protein
MPGAIVKRRAYNEFIQRHEVTWELGMAILAIVFVIVGFATDAADDATRPALEAADTALIRRRQPKVKQYTSTPASRNSISNKRSWIRPGWRISW